VTSTPVPGGQRNTIVALLPAHNEAESIATTLRALRAQTRAPDLIIVICDNCTDATAQIAREHGATVWNTSGNTHEAMLTWGDLARQRLRWKRGAFEDLLSFGLTRHTLKGWGLQLVSTLGVIATLVYAGTLLAAPWLGFHPRLWCLAITMVYAFERIVTVRSRGWQTQLCSAAVFPEWFYDLFLQSVQVRALWGALWRTSKSW
jgi:cellulose synthase/poly-beta-1,6-N-acetylglucosamine synthase-like glycosyltransferase